MFVWELLFGDTIPDSYEIGKQHTSSLSPSLRQDAGGVQGSTGLGSGLCLTLAQFSLMSPLSILVSLSWPAEFQTLNLLLSRLQLLGLNLQGVRPQKHLFKEAQPIP